MNPIFDDLQSGPGEPVIDVDHLFFILNGRRILSEVTFKAYRGEITAILGISGSGKTTVLKHLLGLYPSMGDSVRVMGVNPSGLDENEEREFYGRIGVLYQEGALLNSLTVGENIGLPLEHHTSLPLETINDMVWEKLRLVNLEHTFHKYPSQLSGGMLKRAAIARAIIMDPPLLFCDEPGAGLDPVSLSRLDNLILDLKQLLGMTIIMVTHEVSSVRRMADRIVFMEDGHSLFVGSLERALSSEEPALKEYFSSVDHEK